MSGRFILTPRARADLDEIWHYTADRWGIEQAETYIRELWRHIQAVADAPSLGRESEEARPGSVKYPSGSHVLFNRLTDSGVDIVRILHERMDSSANFVMTFCDPKGSFTYDRSGEILASSWIQNERCGSTCRLALSLL